VDFATATTASCSRAAGASIVPGHTQLTRMPCYASSCAAVIVKARMAYFDIVYGAVYGVARRPADFQLDHLLRCELHANES
jgi:hypothetical protein